MAISCYGFDGDMPEKQFAAYMSHMMGSPYGILSDGGRTHYAVTKTTAFGASVAAGVAFGYGVACRMDAPYALTFNTPASGTRWDFVYLRRDWTVSTTRPEDGQPCGGSAWLVVLEGTSSYAHPSTRRRYDGVPDAPLGSVFDRNDQPIAAVLVGATGIQEIRDLRAFPGPGGIDCWDLLAVPEPKYGTVAHTRSDGKSWLRTKSATGPAEWREVGSADPIRSGTVGSMGAGWASGQCWVIKDGKRREYDIEVRRTGGTITAGSSGNIGDNTMVTLDDKPQREISLIPVAYWNGSSQGRNGGAYLRTDGQLKLAFLDNNATITNKGAGDWSCRLHFEFTVA